MGSMTQHKYLDHFSYALNPFVMIAMAAQTNGPRAQIRFFLDGQNLWRTFPRSRVRGALVVVASTTNPSDQDFLNADWSFIKNQRVDYYGDTINLLSMMLISSNGWIPIAPNNEQ